MYIFATFKHSNLVEIFVNELLEMEVPRDNILIVPLEVTSNDIGLLDTMYQSDGKSLMDVAGVLGTVFMLIGTIYGYVLRIGPVLSGLVGLVVGIISGIIIDYFWTRRKNKVTIKRKEYADIVVTVFCKRNDKRAIMSVCGKNGALAIGIYEGEDSST
ncbi:hypothetical protein [Mangrovibacillus cuniculi]|uniref:Uncharacterized protein n=1 Tax=Mangrovibacillus cuniculi TaxID=2593652 RepID=A0A7S8CA96_9BACI|nr:hypothetical protein [Mangrovibacillus cuniculi]QPC46151.1 hypothetical protein G8O30_03845 [Mangrovibacillus cuniculi]